MVLEFFSNEAQAANARQRPALVQKEIYLLITEEKYHFHVSLLSNVSYCIFHVSHVVGNHIFLNHVRACMFIAGGVLGSCKRGTGRTTLVVSPVC
jgi:hypothetical protein